MELRDERDRIVDELAESMDIKVNREDTGYTIVIDGRNVVQGDNYQQIKLEGEGVQGAMYTPVWADIGGEIDINSGKIKAMMELGDEDTTKYMEYLDQMAVGIIDTMNDANSAGFDINGAAGGEFFTQFKTSEEIITVSGNSQAAIYNIHGTDVIKNSEDAAYLNSGVAAGSGEIEINRTRISYNTSSDSIQDIIDRINDADTGVIAALDSNNRLVLRADKESGYTIREIKENSGTLLQDLGVFQSGATEFNYKDTSTLANISNNRMAVPESGAAERISVAITDVDKIAAAKGKDTDGDGIPDVSLGVGNGQNALAMAKVKHIS